MTGVELLAHVAAEAPDAKRVLLTAYADTEVAMRAINDIRLDHYLMKPWHPPEERLYPVLDDLLEDWRAAASGVPGLADADGDAVCVIGDRLSADSPRVRDLLANNQIAHRWLDVEDSRAGQMLSQASLTADRLPIVLTPDAEPLVAPEPGRACRADRPADAEELVYYDLVVVGAGPAGLAAAVYGASEGLRTVVVERQSFGGQAGMSSRIENYLGFPAGLSGGDLARRATAQARRFGSEILTAPGGGRHRRGRLDPRRPARRRLLRRLPHGAARAGRLVPAARCRGRGPSHRARHLVRHGLHRRRRPPRRPGSSSSAAPTRPGRPRYISPARRR